MASNRFGNIFAITTWGESHGKAIGVVIDGCPAGLELSVDDINASLALRAPGRNAHTSPRKETDRAEIFSGVFEGKTTGAPISIIVFNHDADSDKYLPIKDALRPGHANFTYLAKYGVFDYRGGGRSSARETIGRVAAGSVAKKLLERLGIQVGAFLSQVGSVRAQADMLQDMAALRRAVYESSIFCPDRKAANEMIEQIEAAKLAGDSLGGIVTFIVNPIRAGLGDPIYEKLEANLAKAMMSLPASKGFEIGSGFKAAEMKGSEHNDVFIEQNGKISTRTNFAGGVLGGISTGMLLEGRVAFKPTSSIMRQQETVTLEGEKIAFNLPEGSRHDPCVAIRAVPIVEAMAVLVLADAVLMDRCAKLEE
jgi:chorismate synthase